MNNNLTFSAHESKIVLFACIFSAIGLSAIDFITPSLPYIMDSLHVSQTQAKNLIIVYLIVLGMSQFFYGTFGDNHGRKKAIVIGIVVALIGLIISGLSTNIYQLYLGRIVTAIGTASSPVIARSMIVDVFTTDLQKMKRGFSYFTVVSVLSPALAPMIGGVIQEYSSWHYSFLALALVNVILLFAIWRSMPESHPIPIIKKPLIAQLQSYFSVISNFDFMFYSFFAALIFIYSIGFFNLSPYIFHLLGFSPVENAMFYLIYSVGIIIGAMTFSKILSKRNSYKLLFSLVVALQLLFLFAAVSFYIFPKDSWLIGLFSAMLSLICGILSPLIMSLCLHGITTNKGAYSAMQGAIRMFFCGLGLIIGNIIILKSFVQLIAIFEVIEVIMLVSLLLKNRAWLIGCRSSH